jgi:sigma-E factor negative regulatory protein RseA
MNAEQHRNPLTEDGALSSNQSLSTDHLLSAMADGEADPAEFDALMASLGDTADTLSSWHAYQVVGDVLRGNDDPLGGTSAGDFLAAVRAGLGTPGAGMDTIRRSPEQPVVSAIRPARAEAANDAVFRWKLVAGFASLAAVMAVSWSVVSGFGAGADGVAGAELASSQPNAVSTPAAVQPPIVATLAAPASTIPVTVNTGQGVLIRDAQLETLLAEHRQHGGVSALQSPSGFIRNATYEAAGR